MMITPMIIASMANVGHLMYHMKVRRSGALVQFLVKMAVDT